MSMEFTDNQTVGGGSFLAPFMASLLAKDDDRGKSMMMLAVVIILIIFFIAIIFLALAFRDKGHVRNDYGSIAEVLTPLIAAKSMDNNCKNTEFAQLYEKLEHGEDRAVQRQTQAELGAMGLMMQKTAADNEMKNLEQFGEIKGKLGMIEMGVSTLLQERNNSAIIQGVVNQLMVGKPCLT